MDARPEERSEKIENGNVSENGGEPSTVTTSTSGTSDSVYELPQEKVDKSGLWIFSEIQCTLYKVATHFKHPSESFLQ